MPKSIILFVICYLLFVICAQNAHAQTPTISQTCDQCGWCNPAINPTPPGTWQKCVTCIYQDYNAKIIKPNTYYTVAGCLSTKPEFFVKSILSIVFSISGGIAFLAVLFGSAQVLTSTGDPIRLQNGKDMISSSILGILLIIFSVFLLRVVGFDILKIPGFG